MLINRAVCTAAVCTDLAAEFVRRTTFNTTVIDLCEDMDKFVCDSFRKEYPLRPDQGRLTYDTVLQERAQDVLRNILNSTEPPVNTPADQSTFKLIKSAYDACMDQTAIRAAGITPISEVLGEISKIFTVPDSAYTSLNSTQVKDSDQKELAETQLWFLKNGLHSPVVGIYNAIDDMNPSVHIVRVSPSESLTLSTNYYTDAKVLSEYQQAMSKVLRAVHPAAPAKASADKLAQQVIEFESRISAILPSVDELQIVTEYYNILPMTEAIKLAPILGLDNVIRSLAPSDASFERLITSFPESIQKIGQIVTSTSKETVQTFLMWAAINGFSGEVLATELEPWKQFLNVLAGREPNAVAERWRTCVDKVSDIDGLGWILSRFYIQDHFSEKGKELGEEIVAYLKAELVKSMNSLEWLDESVRKVALEKVNKLEALMGFSDKSPVNVTDPDAVLKFYSGLTTGPVHFNNTREILAWASERSWAKLNKPVDRGEWLMTAQTVNAYNDPVSNVIAFPAAILQVPYFHADIPSYLNFGVTGWTVGHELTHAFDTYGRWYDADGRYGSDWWTNHTSEEFESRAQCFVKQYDSFTVEGPDGQPLHLSGTQTLGENIADAGGIDNAFLAWKQHVEDHPEQDTDLQGMEKWTHDQMFYIAYAHQWCSQTTKNALIGQVYRDVHSPAKFRIKGALQNSKYFREAFNCPAKEPTCKIW